MPFVICFNYIACLCFHGCRTVNLEGNVCVSNSVTGAFCLLCIPFPEDSSADKHNVSLCDALAMLQ